MAGTGSGMASPPARAGVGLRSLPPSTVTKLGQKPSRHERSLLQVDRSTVRLRPNSVSTGTTDRQLEAREQSPHPSQRSEKHTSEFQSLMRISYAVFCLKKKTKEQQIL